MQNASIERLSRIISDKRQGNNGQDNKGNLTPRRSAFRFHIGIEEGWFSLFLVAVVVYTTIWSVQAAGWVAHLNILTLTTTLGLIGGVFAAKQRRISWPFLHLGALVLGIVIAYWQTAGADYAGNTGALMQSLHHWFQLVIKGGNSDDDSIFLLLITALSFLLAYSSIWLIYHTRSPWLMVVANAVVLLVNLNNIEPGYIIFLIIFLMAALLLLLRFNLFESTRRWKRQGLRYADDLGWDVMQAGALISIGILILSWVLPWGYINDTASQVWNADSNPFIQFQDTWNRVISVSGGDSLSNHGNFRDSLILAGNPNLNNDIVFTVTTDDGKQYLETLSYNSYDGRSWANDQFSQVPLKAGQTYPADSSYVHTIHQIITVVNPPGEQKPYILGAPQIISADLSANVVSRSSDGSVIAWEGQTGKLVAGQQYTVYSAVSSADEKTLQTVPLPVDSPHFPPNYDGQYPVNYYDPTILNSYLQVPKDLDPHIRALAQQITTNAPTMYDKVVALETFLKHNYNYNVNIHLPAGQEGVSWFLFRSGNQGFCNYFSTAMAIMARELGIPARVVAGYTAGQFDQQKQTRVIRGTDAHSWTQIYFAGYGWINFEPSASFTNFDRPLPGQFSQTPAVTNTPVGSSNTVNRSKPGNKIDVTDPSSTGSTLTLNQSQSQLRQNISLTATGLVLLILFGLIFFSIWWSRLFRNYALSAQVYGRMSLLANWAGLARQSSQTPYEYIQTLAKVIPEEGANLERLGDIYVRDLWASPDSDEHPRRTGEVAQIPALWKRIQWRFFFYVIRHPYFLRWLPSLIWRFITRLWAHRQARRIAERDL